MKWNVYLRDVNRQEIKVFNVFDHWTFNQKVNELKEKDLPFEEFAEELKHLAMYHFWSKCEYEVVVTSWPPYVNYEETIRLRAEANENYEKWGHYPNKINVRLDVGKKIDVFNQLQLNWDVFVNYVWNSNGAQDWRLL